MRLLVLALPLAACAPSDATGGAARAATDTAGAELDGDSGPTAGDSALPEVPAWFVVRASLAVIGGEPVGDDASASIDVVDADLARTDCTVSLALDGAVTAARDDEAGLYWWQFPVVPDGSACATLPDTLALGLGALDADLRAQLGAVGHDDVAASLYGAYLRVEEETAAYGYAGTEAALAGEGDAPWPPADGLYQVAPLYLVPLPD